MGERRRRYSRFEQIDSIDKLRQHIDHRFDEVMRAIRNLKRSEKSMNTKLAASIAAAQAKLSDIQGKDASIKAFIVGEPDRLKAALQAFAAEHDIDEDEASSTIDSFVTQASDSVNDTFAAINTNAAPTDTPLEPPVPATGDTTQGAGGGTDTVDAGGGTDSVDGGQGTDSVQA